MYFSKELAEDVGANPERIFGIWSSVKGESDFLRRFCSTSVVVAGFSIKRHFVAFHAFLYAGILMFDKEHQFVQRLQYQAEGIDPMADRQSHMFIEKGYGQRVDHAAVLMVTSFARELLVCNMSSTFSGGVSLDSIAHTYHMLVKTAARIKTEEALTCYRHIELWLMYGSMLESEFCPLESSKEDSNCLKKLKNHQKKYRKCREKLLAGHICGDLTSIVVCKYCVLFMCQWLLFYYCKFQTMVSCSAWIQHMCVLTYG